MSIALYHPGSSDGLLDLCLCLSVCFCVLAITTQCSNTKIQPQWKVWFSNPSSRRHTFSCTHFSKQSMIHIHALQLEMRTLHRHFPWFHLKSNYLFRSWPGLSLLFPLLSYIYESPLFSHNLCQSLIIQCWHCSLRLCFLLLFWIRPSFQFQST